MSTRQNNTHPVSRGVVGRPAHCHCRNRSCQECRDQADDMADDDNNTAPVWVRMDNTTRRMTMEAGKHSFSGACRPGSGYLSQCTFSLGVFQWVPKSGGKGCKKSPVKVRVSGPTSEPGRVESRAAEIAAALDDGTYAGPKHVRV